MRIFDPHIHMFSRTTDDYTVMTMSNIKAVVEPAFWLGSDRRFPESFLDYFNHLITFEHKRAEKYGIKHFCVLGVNPKESENVELSRAVIKRMPEYLNAPNVLGIGEIGFNNNTKNEEIIFREQLEFAEQRKLPVIIHTPHTNKAAGTQLIVDIIKEMKVAQERIVIDHNTEETIDISRTTNCWCGWTIYPITKMSPERTMNMMKKYGIERMLINSSADWGYSDPLAVPKTVHLMKVNGWSEEKLDELVYQNPIKFYSQNPKFKSYADSLLAMK
jgi:predicted metal-dependent TIM-barrel fold hydrolase